MAKKTESDVIIIGGGISGLLCALALAKEGKKVTLIEKAKELGGNARSYEINGFTVDTGVHSVTSIDKGPLFELSEKYFDIKPQYLPHGEYYIRTKDQLVKMPWAMQSWIFLDILPFHERMTLMRLLASHIIKSFMGFKDKNASVYDILKDYDLSEKTLRFADMLCYMLTGVSMKKTPAWRMATGSGYINEYKNTWITKLSKIKKLFFHSGSSFQGYPKGGIRSILESVIKSIPKDKITYCLEEEVLGIIIENGTAKGVRTGKGTYFAKTIVYSGYMKNLPKIAPELPQDFKDNVEKIKQVESLTIWLGLNKKLHWFEYKGSEMWFEEGEYFWAMPTSNYDESLAPKGCQLVGFTLIVKSDNLKEYEKKAFDTICLAFPGIKKYIIMKHIQYTVPEKGALTSDAYFPPAKSPVKNLYLVGTDTDKRSMGITRAAFSVIEALKYMKADGIIKSKK